MAARIFLISTAVSGFVAVALGAFAAHALRDRLDVYSLAVFKTGVEYQFFHAFALGMVGWLSTRSALSSIRASGVCFLVGTVLFSGSLYLLALTRIKALGMITPFGGVAFLLGWLLLIVGLSRMNFPS